jgi:hypothetical protein
LESKLLTTTVNPYIFVSLRRDDDFDCSTQVVNPEQVMDDDERIALANGSSSALATIWSYQSKVRGSSVLRGNLTLLALA